jgi:thioesterase domain-containing protein
LKAVALFSELERCTGKRLPVAALFRAPTVAELAKYNETQEEIRSLVPIQLRGTRLPIFLVHAHGGEVIFYRDLANCLDADQPVYALKARPASGGATRYPTVEEMASFYLEEIRSVQPKGPYYLGGYCLGGIIIYELARQIVRSGEDVALAALFEATPQNHSLFPTKMPRWLRRFFEVLYDVEMHWGSLEMLNSSERVAYLKARIPRAYQLFRRKLFWKLKRRGLQVQPTEKLTLDETIELTQLSIQQSVDRYVPLPYEGRIVLFCPSRLPRGAKPDRSWGWNNVPVKELEIVEIPVRVGAIALYPRAPALAERLKAYLPEGKKPC